VPKLLTRSALAGGPKGSSLGLNSSPRLARGQNGKSKDDERVRVYVDRKRLGIGKKGVLGRR